jgi:predicted transcriptional regulator
MTVMTVKMPDQLSCRLRHEASERGTSCSALVRQALEDMLDDSGHQAQGSCLALAADLAGCVEGSRDLSTHPRHMQDFGR